MTRLAAKSPTLKIRKGSAIERLGERRFVRNVATLVSGTAASQAVVLALTPIVTRLYGPEAFGVFGTFTATLAILTPVAALT